MKKIFSIVSPPTFHLAPRSLVDETRGMKSHGVTIQIKPLADRAIYFCELKHSIITRMLT